MAIAAFDSTTPGQKECEKNIMFVDDAGGVMMLQLLGLKSWNLSYYMLCQIRQSRGIYLPIS